MSNFFTEFFVARRIASRSVMSRIATATAALAIAVMIVAVAVISGFRGETGDKIKLFTGHLRVETAAVDTVLADRLAAVDGVVSVAPYAAKSGVVRTADAVQGVVLKGVADSLTGRDVVVSRVLARLLKLGEGDKLEMLFVDGERPRRELFRVAGFYSSGLDEMDAGFVVTALKNLRRVDGYELTVSDLRRLDEVAGELLKVVPRGTIVRTVTDEYPQLFDWLATHDVNAAVIIAVMVVVALVSMIAALLVMVLERIRMIGVLKTLGMRGGSVRAIFVLRAARILLTGLVAGNVAGIAIALIQKHFGVMKLNAQGYLLSAVPAELDWRWIVALDVGFVAVILVCLIAPTTIISRVTPSESIRYE